MKTALKAALLIGTFALLSCTKEPKACMEIPPEVVVFEEVELINCSQNAADYEWKVETNSNSGGKADRISHRESITHTWDARGTFDISLEAVSENGKKSDKTRKEIEVTDLCYTCRFTYNGDFEYETIQCLSNNGSSSKEDFEANIARLESQGWSCSLQ
ncbi:MAG: hypothetical protein R2813_08245 [Flavobacteriales bacterium]